MKKRKMESLEALKKKIKTAGDLLSVVKTMKALAAVNIRQLERAVSSLDEYSRINDAAWQAFFRFQAKLGVKVPDRAVCLVLGSDQGMCGQFNEVILEKALALEKALTGQGVGVVFWTSGERVRAGLEDSGKTVEKHFPLPGGISGITGRVRDVVQAASDRQRETAMERFFIVFNELIKASGYKPAQARLLPLDQDWLDKYKAEPWPGRCLPLLGLSRKELFSHLFWQYLFVSLYRSYGQSLAAENAARLTAMQAAEKNIEEMGENLQARFRDTRQSTITAELLDVVTGFMALGEDAA